ncbi:MAG: hypothetical protein ABSG53_00120 [Thermoguttaceae bacterium]|jgi:hypothetical protein
MSRFAFPSLARPDVAYTAGNDSVDWSAYYRDSHNRIDSWCGEYQTHGDGIVQHSPAYCTMKENMADYLASLAAWLLEHPGDVESIATRFSRSYRVPCMRFYGGIKYRDDKRQWYNYADKKVTTSASKQHDKRWTEVPEWADGGVTAVFRMVCQDYWSNLERYAFADAISGMAEREEVDFYVSYSFAPSVCGFCGQDETKEHCVPVDTAALRYAYRAVRALVEAYTQRLDAQANLRNYKNRTIKESEATTC